MSVTAEAALGGVSPIVGDPTEAGAVAARLQQIIGLGETFLRATRTTQQTLAENCGESIAALDSKLCALLAREAISLIDAAGAGRIAFQTYGESIGRVHDRGRTIEARVEVLLAAIDTCVMQIEHVSAQLSVAPWRDWSVPPSPDPPIHDASVDAGPASGFDAEMSHVRRSRLIAQWREAATLWRLSLDEIHALQAEWHCLREQRVQIEQQFTTELRAMRAAAADTSSLSRMANGEAATQVAFATGAANSFAKSRRAQSPGGQRNHPLLAGLYAGRRADLLLGRTPSAFEVERWWWSLTDRERQTLVLEAPLVVGNLDGVPIEQRIAANAVSAEAFADAEGISTAELRYWRRVQSGEVKLVVSDPARSRLVEMVGTIGADTKNVVMYLPGTGAQMKHFYAGEAQQVANYIEKYSNADTVVFVCKDGAWVSWAGSNRNTNFDFLAALGEKVSKFQSDVIDRDMRFAGSQRIAMGHSAGMSVLSGAERSGARFDQVLSLGGSFMLKDWQPSPHTRYSHFQYDNDVINRIDGGRLLTPHELTHVYSAQIFPSEGKAEMQSHGRITEGPETNEIALRRMLRVIEEGREQESER